MITEDLPQLLDGKLWKFRAFDERLLSILVEKNVWFANPRSFNDPFDTNQAIIEAVAINQALDLRFDSETCDRIVETINKMRHHKPMACFSMSETPALESNLMWAHYAASHTGVAIGFGNSSKFSEYTESKVYYDLEKRLSLTSQLCEECRVNEYSEPTLKKLFNILFRFKHPHWSYEKEVRFLTELENFDDSGISHEFKSEELTDVVFGFKTSQLNQEIIKRLLNDEGYTHVKLWKVELNLLEMKMRVKPC